MKINQFPSECENHIFRNIARIREKSIKEEIKNLLEYYIKSIITHIYNNSNKWTPESKAKLYKLYTTFLEEFVKKYSLNLKDKNVVNSILTTDLNNYVNLYYSELTSPGTVFYAMKYFKLDDRKLLGVVSKLYDHLFDFLIEQQINADCNLSFSFEKSFNEYKKSITKY